jgi:signal transduction histidine kinase
VLSRVPIRWRLAGGSALLTLVILLFFAIVVGELTTRRIREDFNVRVARSADDLRDRVQASVRYSPATGRIGLDRASLEDYVAADDAVVRVLAMDGTTVIAKTKNAPKLGFLPLEASLSTHGYRMESRYVRLPGDYSVVAQYGRPLSDVEGTLDRVRFLLALGVLGGAGLALAAGLLVARNAMRPIAQLTQSAREIGRTRDPERSVPVPEADDEVATLARTLNEMLAALAAAREETESSLMRQRQFVADASHELRTPLTSVLANLELLVDELHGEEGEAARSALRSSRRMRRLVADLLLLARADVGRETPLGPTDLGAVVVEAAGELGPVSDRHVIEVDAEAAIVQGSRDDLHRLTLNLMENAIKHTPAGTHVRAAVARVNGHVLLTVEDDGPGIAPELRERIFERFVRGQGDRGGSFGLGLSIVRAVADAHGGDVHVEQGADAQGTRFVVTFPGAEAPGTAA